MVFNMVKKET